mmetsp:Transcript_15665/g.59585  ORF Transcript_15665/g.59585 Transcript_15665/m.59585 type:complete len:553 (-) Transcript_15665:269-1927(-)
MVKGNGLRAGFFNPCDVHLARSAMAQIPKPALEGLQNRIERGRPWLRWARRVLSLHVVERIPTGAVRRHEIQALVVVPHAHFRPAVAHRVHREISATPIEAPEGQRGDGARHVIQMQIEHRSLTVRGTRRGRDVRRARPTAPSRRRRARAGHPFHVVPLLLFIKAAAIREKFAEVRPPWPAGRLAMVRLQHFRALVDRRELQIVRGQLDPHLGRRLRLERLIALPVLRLLLLAELREAPEIVPRRSSAPLMAGIRLGSGARRGRIRHAWRLGNFHPWALGRVGALAQERLEHQAGAEHEASNEVVDGHRLRKDDVAQADGGSLAHRRRERGRDRAKVCDNRRGRERPSETCNGHARDGRDGVVPLAFAARQHLEAVQEIPLREVQREQSNRGTQRLVVDDLIRRSLWVQLQHVLLENGLADFGAEGDDHADDPHGMEVRADALVTHQEERESRHEQQRARPLLVAIPLAVEEDTEEHRQDHPGAFDERLRWVVQPVHAQIRHGDVCGAAEAREHVHAHGHVPLRHETLALECVHHLRTAQEAQVLQERHERR